MLPSPTIGLPSLTVVDPPWQPYYKTKVEEVTINQDESVNYLNGYNHVAIAGSIEIMGIAIFRDETEVRSRSYDLLKF